MAKTKGSDGKVHERRQRIDGAAGQQQMIAEEAKGILSPPDCLTLRKAELVYWEDIMLGKAREMWTSMDLIHAVTLSRILYELDKVTKQLRRRDEGRVKDDRLNPLHKVAMDLTDRAMKLSVYLQIHPVATQGKGFEQRKRNQYAKEAREKLKSQEELNGPAADDDDLIARPNTTIQ